MSLAFRVSQSIKILFMVDSMNVETYSLDENGPRVTNTGFNRYRGRESI